MTLQYDPLSRLSTMIDSGGTTANSYSARSELVGQVQAGGFQLTMAYDQVGNRTLLVDSDGGYSTTTFDALNRVSTTVDPSLNVSSFQYDIDSRRTTLQSATRATRIYRYDAASRLTSQIELNASGGPIITMVDAYDNVGNRLSRFKDGTTTSWSYDSGYRLIGQAVSGGYATFVYDNAGNTLVKWQQGTSPMSFAYDNANRIVTMLQGTNLTSYLYDATGNLTQENLNNSLTSYRYDNENRLLNIQFPGGTFSTYTYSGDGLRRSAFEAGGSPASFIWDGVDYLGEA